MVHRTIVDRYITLKRCAISPVQNRSCGVQQRGRIPVVCIATSASLPLLAVSPARWHTAGTVIPATPTKTDGTRVTSATVQIQNGTKGRRGAHQDDLPWWCHGRWPWEFTDSAFSGTKCKEKGSRRTRGSPRVSNRVLVVRMSSSDVGHIQ